MSENEIKNNLENNLYECPRCHIKLNKKEIQLHNIKCRIINNQIEKNINDITRKMPKDEYTNFIEKFQNTNIDENNIKTLIKNFITIFSNKIELLENNIQEINNQIKKINDNYSFYFKKINDSLESINKKYYSIREANKNKQNVNTINTFQNKPLLSKNETDLNIFLSKKSKNSKKIHNPLIIKESDELKAEISNSYLNSKKINERQRMSEKNVFDINKEKITQFNNDNIFNENKKYKEIIKREKKKENKYKIKKLKIKNYNDNFYKIKSTNILTEEISTSQTSNNNLQINMRRSLSFGDLKNLISKGNKKNSNNEIKENEENEENIENNENDDDNNDNNENIDNNDILVGSLDIIMDKISKLEETLINIGLNDNELKDKILSLENKDDEYSNSESVHSEET